MKTHYETIPSKSMIAKKPMQKALAVQNIETLSFL
jgi:hypothetical protein